MARLGAARRLYAQLPEGFPADLADSILQGILSQARRLDKLAPP
jgi:hypothetical protein